MNKHLNIDQLLEYHTGLLETDSAKKAHIEQHLQSCEHCATQWRKMQSMINATTNALPNIDDTELSLQLQERRNEALKSVNKPNFVYKPFVNIAASLLLAAGLAYFLYPVADKPVSSIAEQTFVEQQRVEETSEIDTSSQQELEQLVSAVDFFLWLDKQSQKETEG